MKFLVGCISGILFGAGLVIVQMTDPSRVLGFLDLLDWDPRLGFVMLGAILVHAPFVLWLRRRGKPMMAQQLHLPVQSRIDRRLIIGAAVFGVGWGLGGYCPGPALASAATNLSALLLTLSMFVGMLLHDVVMTRRRVQAHDTSANGKQYESRQGVFG
jgi:uncharacterized membrane protein YedE/YeeE